MAAVACLGFEINHFAVLSAIGREGYLSPLVVDPYPADSRLTSLGPDDLIDVLFPVQEHAVARRALNNITHAVRTFKNLRHHLISIETDRKVGVHPEEDQEEKGTKEQATFERFKPSHSGNSPFRFAQKLCQRRVLKNATIGSNAKFGNANLGREGSSLGTHRKPLRVDSQPHSTPGHLRVDVA